MADDTLTAAEVAFFSRASAASPSPKPAAQTLVAGLEPRPTRAGLKQRALADRSETLARPPHTLDETVEALLTEIHRRCCRQFGEELSTLLRRTVRVKLVAVQQTRRRDFLTTLEIPTYCGLISAASPVRWLLEMNLAVLFPLIDCLLGGGGKPASGVRRPLTEIELRLAARITTVFLRELGQAWRGTADLDFTLERIEANPRALAAAADEEMACLSFELAFSLASGTLNLAIPLRGLSDLSLSSPPAGGPCEPPQGPAEDTVELVACLARTAIADSELANLAVGDVIATRQSARTPITLLQDGVPRFHAHPGALDGHKAVEITGVHRASAAAPPRT